MGPQLAPLLATLTELRTAPAPKAVSGSVQRYV